MVWAPSASEGVNDQWPLASAVVVPIDGVAFGEGTTALGFARAGQGRVVGERRCRGAGIFAQALADRRRRGWWRGVKVRLALALVAGGVVSVGDDGMGAVCEGRSERPVAAGVAVVVR